eukprot:TRINITY_DN1214_c0_g1_i1.p1 TRINITY_DN1214_c0_g1~~TRINITY_DN1214_c0_g1_i1.p1  ORF type:complete len:780 (-),score=240.58 TRINITY_DN1214_c0_g1_i1:189-2468(-)
MDFDALEEQDGTRFSFNVWPSTRIEANRLVVPLGCLYTPLKENMPQVTYPPVLCKSQNCHVVLNPYCFPDFQSKMWTCPMCMSKNPFPSNYAGISETNLPAELIARYSTIDYVVQQEGLPPVFLFVIDLCLSVEELEALKAALLMALSLMPQNALVGLITFGKTVQLFELAFDEIPKCYVFNGAKDVTQKQIQDLLTLGANRNPQTQTMGNQIVQSKFLMPIQEVDLTFTSIIEEMQVDPNPVKSTMRPLRATGVALSVAVGLLQAAVPNTGARVMLFTGGPCTYGPGIVVSEDLKETIRSHTDIAKENTKYTKKAYKFYEELGSRAVSSGHTIDLYPQCYDQPGYYEMQELSKKTGGLCVLADAFSERVFKDSFQKVFTKNEKGTLNLGFNATIEIMTSRELKVQGAIGHCASANKKGSSVSETELGIGGTTAWKIGALDPSSTLSFFFEVANQQSAPSRGGVIQFQTVYQNANGQKVMRVTTLSRAWDSSSGPSANGPNSIIAQGFDQEAAAVLMARIAVFKAESEEAFDVLRWLDRMLIKLVSKFAQYTKDDPDSFQLSRNFGFYPQFMFHLRRSHFLQVWNSSPDETAFYRYMLNRENATNTLIMVQPTLEAYSFQGEPQPVLLASTSIKADQILVFDSFFRVVIHYGDTIAQWRKAKYHEDPQHHAFKTLLERPKADALELVKKRFPTPRFIETDQGQSQARFLLATIDPVITHESRSGFGQPEQKGGEVVFTEDVNWQVFEKSLIRLAVQSSS